MKSRFFKRFVSVAISLIMLLGILVVSPIAADANIALKVERNSYLQGETVTSRIYFPSQLNTIASLDLVLTYDSSKLEVVSVTDGNGLKNALNAQENGKVYSENHKNPGTINWSLAATTNFDFNGVFAYIKFNVKNTASNGDCTLQLTVKNAANSGYVDMTSSVTTRNATFEIIKVAANELIFDLTEDKSAYEIVAYYCATVDNITIPSYYANLPVVGIAENAFSNHAELKKIVLPSTLKYIGNGAFSGCSGFSSIIIPDTVETIGERAFSGCTELENITLPIGLERIEKKTFYNCSFMESIEIPFTVKRIASGAFENCVSLNSVKISRNTNNISSDAFYNCYSDAVFKSTEGCTYLESYLASNFSSAKIKIISDFSDGTAVVADPQAYTGSPVTPAVTIKLNNGKNVTLGTDYKVVYKNNTQRGTAKVYAAGLGENGEGYIINFTIACQHKFDKKELLSAATCTVNGKYKYTCSICGDTKTEIIPASGHHPGEWIYDVRPTITKEGLKHNVCDDCKSVVEKNVVVPKVYPDINKDGAINSTDALIVLQYSVGKKNFIETTEDFINADTNGDGNINSSDALNVLLISVGKIKL